MMKRSPILLQSAIMIKRVLPQAFLDRAQLQWWHPWSNGRCTHPCVHHKAWLHLTLTLPIRATHVKIHDLLKVRLRAMARRHVRYKWLQMGCSVIWRMSFLVGFVDQTLAWPFAQIRMHEMESSLAGLVDAVHNILFHIMHESTHSVFIYVSLSVCALGWLSVACQHSTLTYICFFETTTPLFWAGPRMQTHFPPGRHLSPIIFTLVYL